MKKRKNLKAEIREILSTTVVVRRGSRSQTLSLLGAVVVKQADRALHGNDRAAKAVIEVGGWCGALDGSHEQHALDFSKLTDDEVAALEKIVAKSQITVRDEDEE